MITRRGTLRVAAGATIGASLLSVPAAAQSDPVDELWAFEIDGEAYTSPTVVDGTVYIASDDSKEGTLYAIDAGDGTELWSYESVARIGSTPFVTGDTVFFGDNDGNLFALDATDGSERWSLEDLGYVQSPTVTGGTVYVSGSHTLYAVDAEDGAEQWTFETEEMLTSPTIADGTVHVGGNDTATDGTDNVYALDATDGTERWTFDQGGQIGEYAPTVADGTAFITDHIESAVYALDAADGSTVWEATVRDPATSPTIADGIVLVGTTDASRGLVALDAANGDELWAFDNEEAFSGTVTMPPTVVDGTVFVIDDASVMYALDLEDGSEEWNASPDNYEGEFGVSFPTIVDGTIYVGSDTGHALALDAGVDGSSEDSRVVLGTFGHHDAAAGVDDDTTEDESDDDGSSDDDGGDGSSVDDGGDGSPGFGIGASIASVGGATYLLSRRAGTGDGH